MTANIYILILSIILAIATYNYFNKRTVMSPSRSVLQNVLKFVKYYFVMSAYYIVITLGYSFAVVSTSQATNNVFSHLTKNDITTLKDYEQYTKAWNQTSGKIIGGYLNTSVSREDWVTETNVDLPVLRGIVLKMNVSLVLVDDKEMIDWLTKFVENYKEKLNGITNLHLAVAQGNAQWEKDALIELDKAAKKGQAMGLEFLAEIKDLVDPETLRKMSKEAAEASAEALQQPAQ